MRLGLLVTLFCLSLCSGVGADPAPELTAVEPEPNKCIGSEADVRLVEESLTVYEHASQTIVMGEIRNHGLFPARFIKVQIAGFDETNNLVSARNSGDRYTSVFYGSTCDTAGGPSGCILPDEVGWFSSTFVDPVDENVDFTVLVSGAQDGVALAAPAIELVGELQVRDFLYGVSYTGTVRNVGSTDIVGLSAVSVVRDSSGALVDISQRSHGDGSRIGGFGAGIRAGQEAEIFLSAFTSTDDFHTCELYFQGQSYQGGSFQYAVAGIAHQDGYDEVGWRSSLSVTNRSGADGQLRLRFYHSGSVVEQQLTLSDGGSTLWDDVVASLFEIEEDVAGFVRVDSDVPLTITARTWNSSHQGGFGQLMPTLTPSSTLTTSQDSRLFSPVRGGPAFRTNIGFLNVSDEDCSVMVRLYYPNGELFAENGPHPVAANSWNQINDVVPAELGLGYAVVTALDWGYALWTYASVIDAVSGDPTTISPAPEVTIMPDFAEAAMYARDEDGNWSD